MKQVTTLVILAVLVVLPLTGCVKPYKERIVLLEDANQSLASQLAELSGQLAGCHDQLAGCGQRLETAVGEVNDLRAQLAAIPEPQPQVVQQVAPGWTPVPGGAMISIESEVLFGAGSAKLIPEARRSLDGIVGTVQNAYSDKDILIFGHTDSEPISKSGFADNYQLSSERSLAVVRYLKDRGVSPARLVACGCGEHRPKAPNNSYANMTLNRRVEIFAVNIE